MSKHLTKNAAEIVILQKNLKDLQGQLANAQKRILELIQDKDSATEELIKERQLLVELEKDFSRSEQEASEKIAKQIEDWPDVLDSKPKTFKQPPQPGYRFREGEKWVKIGADGEMEFEDIEIKK
jgi:predicted transcriptional regulator